MQKLKELIKVSNLCNFQLFASDIEGNISHQKLLNCWVAKKLMSHTFSVKFRVFRREFLRNHSVHWGQIFRDNWNCYALSIFRVFILLASSDSDKHMLMRQKDSPTSNLHILVKALLRGTLPDYRRGKIRECPPSGKHPRNNEFSVQ